MTKGGAGCPSASRRGMHAMHACGMLMIQIPRRISCQRRSLACKTPLTSSQAQYRYQCL